MSQRVIASRMRGYRRIAGADWPVFDALYRVDNGRRITWDVVRGLCNGTPDTSSTYLTKRAALYALDADGECPFCRNLVTYERDAETGLLRCPLCRAQ